MENKYEQREFNYQVREICEKEAVTWLLVNVIKGHMIPEERMAWRVLCEHFKRTKYSEEFDTIAELNLMVWRNHFKRGLDISEDEVIEKSKCLGLWVFKLGPSKEDEFLEHVSKRNFRKWFDEISRR